jgi:hypothetical protein
MMPNLDEIKKLRNLPLVERMVLNYLTSGTRLRLREDVYRHLKEREWIFNKIRETGDYGVVVGIEDIDWSVF